MASLPAEQPRHVQQRIADGVLEGTISADGKVAAFKGVPYATPPLGALRWKPPQPVAPWSGVRAAVGYGPRPMQGRVFDDMMFHDGGPSEDCLYLNLWIPEDRPHEKLPVMVWIFGGGFAAGSTSEPRQDGGNLCQKGVIVVSLNYRLGVFGFLSLPGLTAESEYHASGNYGLLDQIAALQWVRRNIADFGGDPDNVTIFGESAGSESVNSLMASPLALGLFRRAIGESGALFELEQPVRSLAEAERSGADFAKKAFGTESPDALRAIPAKKLLAAALKVPRKEFQPIVDGYVFPSDVVTIYRSGQQAHVPLLAGWNRDEGNWRDLFGRRSPTLANYEPAMRQRYPKHADEYLKVYPATNDAEAKRAAADLEGDRFMGYTTWKWLELHRQTGESPVYRYKFEQAAPLAVNARLGEEPKATHASDIEFVFRTLPSRRLPWRASDRFVSELMASYWTNFAKNGDPNGPGLPEWPKYDDRNLVIHLQAEPLVAPDIHRARYQLLDQIAPVR